MVNIKAIANSIRLQFTESGTPEIILSTQGNKAELLQGIVEQKAVIANGKLLDVEIKQYRNKRSLDANAYLWVLLSKMAAILHTTKDELYLIMLERYGVYTHIIVKPSVVDKVKSEWRTVRELGEVKVNGQTGIQLQCFFGSHSYDTKEMSVLIDGVVNECKEMGIETMTPAEIASMKEEWGK